MEAVEEDSEDEAMEEASHAEKALAEEGFWPRSWTSHLLQLWSSRTLC